MSLVTTQTQENAMLLLQTIDDFAAMVADFEHLVSGFFEVGELPTTFTQKEAALAKLETELLELANTHKVSYAKALKIVEMDSCVATHTCGLCGKPNRYRQISSPRRVFRIAICDNCRYEEVLSKFLFYWEIVGFGYMDSVFVVLKENTKVPRSNGSFSAVDSAVAYLKCREPSTVNCRWSEGTPLTKTVRYSDFLAANPTVAPVVGDLRDRACGGQVSEFVTWPSCYNEFFFLFLF